MGDVSRRTFNAGWASFLATGGRASAQSWPRIGPQVSEAKLFRDALEKERPKRAAPSVTGVTVPHHLLAPDLIARGIWAASGNSYDRIVLMSPDHFRKTTKLAATTLSSFDTALGPVETDRGAVAALLQHGEHVEASDLFAREHGVLAILPFLAHIFPGVPIVPLALDTRSQIEDWEILYKLIATIVSANTLVVQSTDYSHYLLPGTARQRDQETLNLIAVGAPAAAASLHQSNHIDSKAAQYVQMRLQQEVFGSRQVVVANRNSTEYSNYSGPSTSYMVSVFARDPAVPAQLQYSDQGLIYFGGDVFLGRYFNDPLSQRKTIDALVERVRQAAGGGAQLVVNLEGAVSQYPVATEAPERHFMHADLALPMLRAMNVCAVSLANNHSYDLGRGGVVQLRPLLAAAGIKPVENMETVDLGGVSLMALNFVGDGDHRGYPVVGKAADMTIAPQDRARLLAARMAPPLIAFVHWGREYTREAEALERGLADDLVRCGATLVVGAHSHQRSPLQLAGEGQGLMLYSLGNLLFDQRSPRGDGAMLEVRTFTQGTIAARVVEAPNYYEVALDLAGRG